MNLRYRFFWKWWLLCLAGFWLGVQTLPANAGAEVRQVSLTPSEDSFVLTGNFSLQLSPALIDAVNHGIPLVFQMQSEVRRPRWYWSGSAGSAAPSRSPR